MKKALMAAMVAFCFAVVVSGCGGGGGGTTLDVPQVDSRVVNDTINTAPGLQVVLYANEVLGVYHENDSDRYTSWRVKCDAPYNNGIGAYPRVALDYHPDYFENIVEPGLTHPEWSRTWAVHYAIPENATSGTYDLNCSATNNKFSTHTVNINYTVNVSGEPKNAPYTVERGTVPNGVEYIILHNTDGNSIGEVVIVTATQIIRPTLLTSSDFAYVAFSVGDSGVGVREEAGAQMYVSSYYDTAQHTYVLPYPVVSAQRQSLRAREGLDVDNWSVKHYKYKYDSSGFSDR